MNRWITWAHHLRCRHERREARRALGAMVLARTAALTQVFVTSHRSSVHVHARLGITRVPSPQRLIAMAAGPMIVVQRTPSPLPARDSQLLMLRDRTQRSIRSLTERHHDHTHSTSMVAERAPLFQETTRTHAVRWRSPETLKRRVTSLRELVVRWQRHSTSQIRTLERSVRPVRAVVRRELPIAEKARVLARTRVESDVGRDESRSSLPVPFRTDVIVPPGASASPIASPISVDALTSQVIQQLDRRLLAYRERMGRV